MSHSDEISRRSSGASGRGRGGCRRGGRSSGGEYRPNTSDVYNQQVPPPFPPYHHGGGYEHNEVNNELFIDMHLPPPYTNVQRPNIMGHEGNTSGQNEEERHEHLDIPHVEGEDGSNNEDKSQEEDELRSESSSSRCGRRQKYLVNVRGIKLIYFLNYLMKKL